MPIMLREKGQGAQDPPMRSAGWIPEGDQEHQAEGATAMRQRVAPYSQGFLESWGPKRQLYGGIRMRA